MMNMNLISLIYKVNNIQYVPLSAAFLIEIFSTLQILQLIFASMAKFSPSSHFIILSLNKNLCFLTGAFPLSEISVYNSMFLGIWICCLIYFVFHIGLLLISFILSKNHQNLGGRTLTKILSWLYLLHSRIVFFPMQFFLLNLCNIYSSPKDPENFEFYQQAGWLIGSVLLLIANTSLALCKEFIMYKINQTEDHYATKTNMYHQLMLVYKIIALLLYFWGVYGTSAATKGSTVFHLIMGIFLLLALYVKLPFYHFRVLKLTISLTTMVLCLSMISLIYVYVEDVEVVGGMHILILLLPPLGIKFVLSQFQNLFKRILRGEFMLADHTIHFGLLLEDFLMREGNKIPDDLGFMPNRESYYGVLNLAENKIPLEKFTDKRLISECEYPIYLHVIDKIRLALIKTPNSKVLSLYKAQICLTKIDDIPRTLEVLRRLETENSSLIPIKSSIQYVNELLEKVYNEDGMGSEARLGLSHYFKYYDIANSIKTLMLAETKKQIEFWEEIKKRDLDAKKVYDKVQEIDKIFLRIRKECELNLNNFRKNFTSPMLLYSVYLNNVRQMHFEGIHVLRSFQSIMFAQNTNNELEAASGNLAVVIVSLDKARAGMILNASGSIHNIFNLKKTELIGKKVGCLFPSSIAKMYQQNIQQYAKAPEYKLDYKEKTYGKTKNDEIFELEAHFQLYPYVGKELTLMVMLKKLDDPAPILIANNEGVIVDFSKTLEFMFSKEAMNIKTFRTLQSVNPGFEDINLAFNIVYSQGHSQPDQGGGSQQTPLKEKLMFSFDNTAIGDFEESSRYTGRSLLHGLTDRVKFSPQKTTPGGMPFDRAEFICQEYIEGKPIALNPPETSSLLKKNKRLKAHIHIKPFRAEGDVYKVVRITSLKRDATSSFRESLTTSRYVGDEDYSIHTFGDEFPADNEKVTVKKVSAPKVPKTKGTMASTYLMEDKKSYLIDSDESNEKNQDQMQDAQKKLNDLQHFWDQDDQRSSIMNSHHQESRTVRTLRDIGSRKKLQRSLSSLQISLYLVIAVVLILSFVKYELSKSSIEEIQKGINIINTATLRLQNAINTWLWTLVFVTGVETSSAMQFLTTSIGQWTESSTKLENELGLVRDNDFINRAYEKDVRFWQLAVQGDVKNEIVIDTFTATNILMTKYLTIKNVQSIYQVYAIPDLTLIFNNTANDYITSSKNLISATDEILDEIIEKDIRLLDVVLAIEIVVLVGYVSVFIIMIYIISKSYSRLCRALLRTQEVSIVQRISQLNKVKTLLEDDIERKAFIQDGFDLFIEERSLGKANDAKGQKTTHQSNLHMSSMTKYLIKIAILCLLFIPMLGALFIGTLVKSINTFNKLESVNEELSMLSDGSLQSNLMMSTLVYNSVFGAAPNMLVMNKAPVLQIMENLKNFNGLNQRLIETFLSSKERDIDPYFVEILQTNVCRYLSDVSKPVCERATNNQKMGLLGINTDYYNMLLTIIGTMSANITLAEALVIYANFLNKIIGELGVLIEIYPIMMAHILEAFEETVQTSKNDEGTFIIVIFVTVILYTIFIYLKPLKDFQKVDIGRRKILKIIPVSVIQENKALKFYLMQDFKTEIEEIKNTL